MCKRFGIAVGYKGVENIRAAIPNEQDVINISAIEDKVLSKWVVGPDVSFLPVAHG